MNSPTEQLNDTNSMPAIEETKQLFRSEAEIQSWLVAYLSEVLEVSVAQINPTASLASYGLDSSGAIGLVSDLSEYIGYELAPDLLMDCSTIQSLARYCSELEEVTL